MKSKTIARMAHSCRRVFTKHGHEILTAGCVISTVGAVTTAVLGTLKAKKLVEEKKEELKADSLTPKETVTLVWPCFVNTALFTAGSIGCALGAFGYSKGKYASILSVCAANAKEVDKYKSLYREYKEAAKSKGEDKSSEKKTESAPKESKTSEAKPREDFDSEVHFGSKKHLFCEPISGRYFESTSEKIGASVNDLNARLINWGDASLNDWYDYIHLNPTLIGDDLGWSLKNNSRFRLEVGFIPRVKDGEPYLELDYNRLPVYDYE